MVDLAEDKYINNYLKGKILPMFKVKSGLFHFPIFLKMPNPFYGCSSQDFFPEYIENLPPETEQEYINRIHRTFKIANTALSEDNYQTLLKRNKENLEEMAKYQAVIDKMYSKINNKHAKEEFIKTTRHYQGYGLIFFFRYGGKIDYDVFNVIAKDFVKKYNRTGSMEHPFMDTLKTLTELGVISRYSANNMQFSGFSPVRCGDHYIFAKDVLDIYKLVPYKAYDGNLEYYISQKATMLYDNKARITPSECNYNIGLANRVVRDYESKQTGKGR